MPDLVIPDDSQFQGTINWPTLADHLRRTYGGAAAITRVNYGAVAVDTFADRNIDGARAAGFDVLGWYCYLRAGDDPVAAANVFGRVLQAHGGLRPNEFVDCDDEEGSGDQAGRVNAFLDRVDAILREKPEQDAWYSGLNFAVVHNLAAARGHRWIAAYGAPEPSAPHDLWQFTDAMAFPGISGPCDASVFHGSIDDLRRLIGASGVLMFTPSEKLALVHRWYATYCGRVPETEAVMEGWAARLVDDRSNVREVQDQFADTPEAQAWLAILGKVREASGMPSAADVALRSYLKGGPA